MKTNETKVVVDDLHRSCSRPQEDVAHGANRAVMVIECARAPLRFPALDVRVNLPEDFTFQREQVDDDGGRGG